jgi:hypothetical protein
MIPISYVTCAMKYKHLAEGLGVYRRAAVLLGKLLRTCFAPPPGPPGNSGRSSATPARPSGPGPEGRLGTARFSTPLELKKRRSAPTSHVWALVQLHPPKPPPRPAGGSQFALGTTWGGLVGGRGHRKGQLRVLGSPSALRTKKPRTGGHRPGPRAAPIFFAKAP